MKCCEICYEMTWHVMKRCACKNIKYNLQICLSQVVAMNQAHGAQRGFSSHLDLNCPTRRVFLACATVGKVQDSQKNLHSISQHLHIDYSIVYIYYSVVTSCNFQMETYGSIEFYMILSFWGLIAGCIKEVFQQLQALPSELSARPRQRAERWAGWFCIAVKNGEPGRY